MNLISAYGISKYFAEKKLFENSSFSVEEGEKIALTGINGAGKSTLLKIICGETEPDEGVVARNNLLKMAVLEQKPSYVPENTILEHLFNSDDPKLKLIGEYELSCLNKYSGKNIAEITEKIDALQAWDAEHEIKAILDVLGIKNLSMKMNALSGGMTKKVALAQMLIKDSNLLVLDEPTNHLDIETIIWLENYLVSTSKAVVMVTHDRYFLDSICSGIYEIHRSKILHYKGNYKYYLEKHSEFEHNLHQEENRIKTVLKRELAWFSRGARARSTKAKGRINNIDRMVNREKLASESSIEFKVEGKRLGNQILEIENISKSFTSNILIDNFSYTFKKGERIGIIGANGSGKSTFLDLITERISPDKGRIIKGSNTFFGYFDQKTHLLPMQTKVLEYIKSDREMVQNEDGSFVSASQMLEYFLFPDSVHYTPIEKLSGGEQKRLYLVKMLMENPNFIILDEPTNDLDVKTLSLLESFLDTFKGCLVVVSHDRYFLDRTTDYLLAFDGNGKITGFVGSPEDYFYEKKSDLQKNEKEKTSVKQENIKPRTLKNEKKLTFKEKFELENLEPEIEILEKEIAELEKKLSEGGGTVEDLFKWGVLYQEKLKTLDLKIERWGELSEKI